MTTATLSILGLYNYIGDELFEKMMLPEGIDRDLTIETIVIDAAELELLYPDADFLKIAIGNWSKREQRTWSEFLKAANAQYDPIENYDRKEEWTDTGTGTATSTGTSTGNNTDTNTTSVAGYNSNDLQTSGQTEAQNTGSTSSTSNAQNTGTNAHTGRVHGNIGVTTAPKMLSEFIEITPKLNIYDYISASFRHRFCIEIY